MLLAFCLLILARPFIPSLASPLADAAFSVFSLSFILAWFIRRRPLTRVESRPLLLPSAVFLFLIAVSAIVAADRSRGFRELANYFMGICLLFAALSLEPQEKETMLKTLLATGLIISAGALYQFFFGFGHLAAYLKQTGGGGQLALDYVRERRAFFPFVTPNLLGGYLAMLLPLAFYFRRSFWLAIPLAAALLLSRSLGAFAAAACGLLFFLFFSAGKARRLSLALLAALLAVGSLVYLTRQEASTHLSPAFSSFMRIGYWRDALHMVTSLPLTGVGPGNFDLMRSHYAHNSFLQLAAETGLPALAAFLWLAVAALRGALKRTGTGERNLRLLVAAAALIFLAHNLVDFSFFLPEISFVWWVLLGL